ERGRKVVTVQVTAEHTGLASLRIPATLTPESLEQAARPIRIDVDEEVRGRVARCREFVSEYVASGNAVYGATTGFGPLVTFAGRETPADQCDNAINHLLAGHGDPLPEPVVRAAVLARLWSLSRGHSGVSTDVVDSLVAMLGTDFAPVVPRWGSVGASGDLVPLAYVAQALRGHGHATVSDVSMPAADALRLAGLRPLELDGRDALALVNGTSVTVAAAGLAVAAATRS